MAQQIDGMEQRAHDNRQGKTRPRVKGAVRIVLLLLAGSALTGCATGGAQMSAFVDPAKYATYDCKQLNTARKLLFRRVSELQGLMAKAEQGVGGALVSGLAYQTEYLSARDDLRLVDETRQQNNCPDVSMAPDELPDAQKAEPSSRAKKR